MLPRLNLKFLGSRILPAWPLKCWITSLRYRAGLVVSLPSSHSRETHACPMTSIIISILLTQSWPTAHIFFLNFTPSLPPPLPCPAPSWMPPSDRPLLDFNMSQIKHEFLLRIFCYSTVFIFLCPFKFSIWYIWCFSFPSPHIQFFIAKFFLSFDPT